MILSVVHDLREQRQLEEQLRQAQRLESVGQLAGGVAHNFNNALAAIIGYSELIARQLEDTHPVLPDAQKVLTVAEQSASLTQQLLTFSRKGRVTDPHGLQYQRGDSGVDSIARATDGRSRPVSDPA